MNIEPAPRPEVGQEVKKALDIVSRISKPAEKIERAQKPTEHNFSGHNGGRCGRIRLFGMMFVDVFLNLLYVITAYTPNLLAL